MHPPSGEIRESGTGLKIFERSFGDPTTARAGALLLHGLGEHCGRHEDLMTLMASHGIHCRAFDWPGHGQSEGRRGHLESMDLITALINEQRQVLTEALPAKTPIGLLGHSMGGFLVLCHLARYPEIADFAWVGSPLINPEANASLLKRKVARLLNTLYPQFQIHSGIKTNQCRIGPEKRQDPLMHRVLTVRLGTILVDAAHELAQSFDRVNPALHLLMTHGDADVVCPPEFSMALFERLPCKAKRYEWLPGALHEPFLGEHAAEYYACIESWLTDHVLPSLAP